MSGVVGGCFDSDNQILAVSDGDRVFEFDVPSGRILREIESKVIPRVFLRTTDHVIAHEKTGHDAGTGRLLLVDRRLGLVSILARNHKLRDKVAVIGDDDAVFFQTHRWSAKMTRLLKYEELLTELHSTVDQSKYISIAETKPANDFLEVATVPEVSGTELPILNGDNANLLSEFDGKKILVRGVLSSVKLTRQKNAANLSLALSNDAPLLVWIKPDVYKLVDSRVDLMGMIGKEVQIEGVVGKYAGFDKSLINMWQLSVQHPWGINIENDGTGKEANSDPLSVPTSPVVEAVNISETTNLKEYLGKTVVLDGTILDVVLTFQKDAANLLIKHPSGEGLLIWIDPRNFKTLKNDGTDVAYFKGRKIRVSGRLRSYGGKSEHYRGYFQIEILGSNDLKILEP